jgi:hypothetical protein
VRRSLVAAVVPLALSSLAACGGDDSSSAKSSGSSASPTSTAPAAPATGATESASDFVDRYRAAFDAITTAHATMTMEIMGGKMTGAGDLDYSHDHPAASMTMNGGLLGSGNMEIRLVDDVMYMNLGSMTGGKFARLPLDDPNNPLGGTFADALDPSRAMDSMQSALQQVTYVGHDSAGDHYRATVDTAKMLANMGQKVPADAGLPKTMTYETWFDDQGRFTKMVIDMGSLGTTTMQLSDFGKDVSIEAPPTSEVTDGPMHMAG